MCLRGRRAQVTEIRYLRTMISGVPVVAMPAEIDITTTDQLRGVLFDAAVRGHATVVVDMSRTRFCDSDGLHVLLRAHERAVAEGGELRLVLPGDGPIPRIVTLMCLDQLIPSFASLAEALAHTPDGAGSPGSRPSARTPRNDTQVKGPRSRRTRSTADVQLPEP
jgi:anti-sigma B factor antagonist